MNRLARIALCVVVSPCAGADVTIVSLPWATFMSAGPRGQNYPPPQDNRDIWVVEDFTTDRDWLVGRFASQGSGASGMTDVFVTILDGLPPNRQAVMQSVRGSGRQESGPRGWPWYVADFGHQRLAAGSYIIMWQADGNPSTLVPVFFCEFGAYAVGQGTPNNGYQYNPGLGAGLPQGALDPVTSGLNNSGDPIGVNFTLMGETAPPLCPADFNRDGGVDGLDVEAFFVAWQVSEGRADVNQDGGVDGADVETFFRAWEVGGC